MATKKTVTKTTKKAESGVSVNLSKKSGKRAVKIANRVGLKVLLFAFIFVLCGGLVGGAAWWIVCRNDCFEIVGSDNISLELDKTYKDEGVKVIAFGKDEKDSVSIDTNLIIDSDGNLKANEEGTYYIKYTSNCFKYGKLFKVEKVRLVTFVAASEGGE